MIKFTLLPPYEGDPIYILHVYDAEQEINFSVGLLQEQVDQLRAELEGKADGKSEID